MPVVHYYLGPQQLGPYVELVDDLIPLEVIRHELFRQVRSVLDLNGSLRKAYQRVVWKFNQTLPDVLLQDSLALVNAPLTQRQITWVLFQVLQIVFRVRQILTNLKFICHDLNLFII